MSEKLLKAKAVMEEGEKKKMHTKILKKDVSFAFFVFRFPCADSI